MSGGKTTGGPFQAQAVRDTYILNIPLRTHAGLNHREHHMVRARRVKGERNAVRLVVYGAPAFRKAAANSAARWMVTLTRVSPGTRQMDDDNLPGSMKAIRDEVAAQLGVDDGNRERIRFQYGQERGPWGVRVEIESVAGWESNVVSAVRGGR